MARSKAPLPLLTTQVEKVLAIKGWPLTILVLMHTLNTRVQKRQLASFLSIGEHQTGRYIDALTSRGYVVQVESWYYLSRGGHQLLLGESLGLPPGNAAEIPAPPDSPALTEDSLTTEGNKPPSISISDLKGPLGPLNTNNNTDEFVASRSQLIPDDPKNPRRLAAILAALGRKGRDRPVEDDPFPPDLRRAVQHLVEKTGAPRRHAELAVAASPWDAPTLLEEINRWVTYKASSAGKSIKPAGFPFLVCKRLHDGERCPVEAADPTVCPVCGISGGYHLPDCRADPLNAPDSPPEKE